MSKITFKEFLEEEGKKDNSKRNQPPVKPIKLKPQVKPIDTVAAGEKRVPSEAELKLKELLRKSKQQGHTATIADILGIYRT